MAQPAVGQLLNIAQDSVAASERSASALWKLALQDPDATFSSLQQCLDYLVTLGQKSPFVERSIRFFGLFASKAPTDSEVAAALIEELLQHLASHLSALDKVVRFRSVQILQLLLAGLPEGLLVEESVVDALRASLSERLHDKLPAVRAEAVRAICHLVVPVDDDEVDEDVVQAVLGLLETDKSKDVRVAVVTSLPLAPSTLPPLLDRLRDVNPLVRKALVLRLKSMSIQLLSIKQRAEIIQQVLRDRDAVVTDAASKLLAHWLQQDCHGDPLQLLQVLDVETYTEAAVLAIESLISSGSIWAAGSNSSRRAASSRDSSANVVAYVEAALQSASSSGGGNIAGGCPVGLPQLAQQPQSRLLQPHEALMWRCLCEWLRSDAISKGLAAAATGGARAAVQAAVAAERHEVLERVLPESADEVMQLVMKHADAGPAARFAASQLLMIAASCVDWTDAASRDMATPYLQQLIACSPTARAEQEGAAGAVSDSDEDYDMSGGAGRSAAASAGLQLAGNGGDGLFEASVVQLVLAVQGVAGGGFAGAMLQGIAGLAGAAGLLGKPQEDGSMPFTVGAPEPSSVLQVLAYIRLMLQQLPSCRPLQANCSSATGLSFGSMWELLLLLALKQEQPDIRAKAVECIALYALAACGSNPGLLSSAVQLLGPLVAAGGCSSIRQAAVRGLVDIALLFGPAAVDSVLRVPAAAVELDAAAACTADSDDDNVGGAEPAGSPAADVGLLELLLGQAEELLASLQAPNGSKTTAKRGSRGAAAASKPTTAASAALSAASAGLLAVIAESLCKLLLHHRSWLSRYKSCQIIRLVNPAVLVAANTASAHSGDGSTAATPAGTAAAADGTSSSTVPLPPDSQQLQARLLRNALSLLLQLQFHPATEQALQLRQTLSLFFDVFAAAGTGYRLQLVGACLPAARAALHINCKKNPAALLVKLVLQLLQANAPNTAGQQHQHQHQLGATGGTHREHTLLGESCELLAQQLLWEVEVAAAITVNRGLQPAKYKPYLSALLKLVNELALQPSHADLAALQALADRLSASISDNTLKKDVAAVQQHLVQVALNTAGLRGLGEQQQLAPEQVEQLVQQFAVLSVQQQLVPLPAEGTSGCQTPAAPRTTRKAAAGTAAAARKPAAAAEAKPPAAASTARRSARPSAAAAAAAAARRRHSSDDDDSSSAESDSTGSTESSQEDHSGASSSDEDDAGPQTGAGEDQVIKSRGGAAGAATAAGAAKAAAAAAAGSMAGTRRSSAARQPLGPSSIVNTGQE